MKRTKTLYRTLAIATAACLLCFTIALAKKPPNTGGGGGGSGGETSYDIFLLTEDILNEDGEVVATFTEGRAKGINDTGSVVGSVWDLGTFHAACWTITKSGGSVESTLHLLPGGTGAQSINDSGEAVGNGGVGSNGNNSGIYWNTANGTQLILPPLDEESIYSSSRAFSINEQGVVCGMSTNAIEVEGNLVAIDTAVVWKITNGVVEGPVALPTLTESAAVALNENDENGIAEVVGSYPSDPRTAIVWTVQSNADGTLQVNSTATPLDTGARAFGVNNLGAVCGDANREAVVWSGGSSTILNSKKFLDSPTAEDINDGGVIVGCASYAKGFDGGERAVVWPSAGSTVIQLDKFLSASSPFLLLEIAKAINESGEIVGFGWDGIDKHAYLAIRK